VLEGFDPESLRFTLRAPHTITVGDRLASTAVGQLVDPRQLDRRLPEGRFVLDSFGSRTSLVRDT